MLSKLAFRNAKRSVRDYIVYLITVILSFSLIFAFNLIVFSEEVQNLASSMEKFKVSVIVVSVIVVFVIGWLINYTMKFMFSKRSKEFGMYMMLGIEKKDIMKMFLIENILLGMFSFVISIIVGYIFSNLLTAVIMNIFELPFKVNFVFSWQPFVLSISYFIAIYLFALLKTSLRMRKMKIYDLLYWDKQNEGRIFKNNKIKKLLFVVFVALGVLALMLAKIGFNTSDDDGSVAMVMISIPIIIISIYGVTITVGDFLIDFVINRKHIKYKNDNLFIARQFTSKIKTMGMTLGTLSLLITLSFLSLSGSMIYSDIFYSQINSIAVYDIVMSEVYTECPEVLLIPASNSTKTVRKYENYIEDKYTVKDKLQYNIYTNEKNTVKKHVAGGIFGYVDVDCFLRVSDYNKLLKMRGLKPINLKDDEFFIHEYRDISQSVEKYLKNNDTLKINGKILKSTGNTYKNFASCWGSGMPYFIIVPDDIVENMKVIDRFIVIDIEEETTKEFYENMCRDVGKDIDKNNLEYDYAEYCIGVKGHIMAENKSVLVIIAFILLYVAFIFTAIVATILAIQALSDSTKYKYHYSILSKLGVDKNQLYKTIRKQLSIFFLFPVIYPIIINISAISSINQLLGPVMSSDYAYVYSILYSFAIFLSIYLIYFVATYFGYKKNITE
ncbi:MAG: ABC transporter permease [Intestinibacter sp.]|uniref:ABC transporter permease n=1 Tax=Intestinibacter sp. TaxID=1965304 RepID=UPI003F13848F